MPYIIAVLALVILGTGYTLFQTTPTSASELTDASPVTTTENSPSVPGLIAEIFDDSDEKTEEADVEKGRNDNSTPATAPEQTTSPKPAPTPTPAPAPAPMPVADNNTYTNGTYYATKSYRTPDGNYQMNVSVTVSSDKITASTLSYDANGARDGYSKRFSSGYQNQIIGKDLGSASLSRVGGASLTTNAFNSALSNIKSQAS